ncbi:GerMN domain-containing protein [Pseudoflavonifractor sp. MSJ-37]|uniref:GerMN domain-containing protein n=1 Tax=Pseudoflavonifractor sp. MSJ-37 TaxID=2841531 RepID=UPI001C11AECE|nr:GerMN domain-containing protein [Pseudoflavonifractor sp. MSJ-37]MBU5435756.1 GerMN domain-containing protein [Pseudoflavonifractor sp. MSJ-37]
MRRRRAGPLLLALLSLAGTAGCVMKNTMDQQRRAESYEVYFAARDDETGTAVAGELWVPEAGSEPVQGLLDQLLAGPAEPGLVSPFPEDLSLRSWKLEEGCLSLDFSEAYEALSGIDLTIANSCLALTLCQAEGVDAVSITVAGEALPQAAEQLRAEDVVLTGSEGEPVAVTATLWFPRAAGKGLGVEYRRLLLSEEDTLSRAVMEALLSGPQYDSLQAVLPADTQLLDVVVEDRVCYVSLPTDALTALEGDRSRLRLVVYAIVNTLAGSIDTVDAVQLRADGQPIDLPDGLGQPLAPDLTLEQED